MMKRGALIDILSPVVAVAAALLVGGLVVLAIGENPFAVFAILLRGAFGTADGVALVLFNACPLIFAGLAVAFAFRAGLFNIGGEGQLYIGSLACAITGLALDGAPAALAVPAALAAAAAGGALWASLPGYLKARLGVHEVINTIMMNFIAIALSSYLVVNVFREAGQMTPQTPRIAEAARLPRLAPALQAIGIPVHSANPLNASLIVALVAVLAAWFILYRTRLGYEIRAVGENPKAAEYAGINVRTITVAAMSLSGVFAGLVASNEVMGFRYRFLDNFSGGIGFLGIAVALLGRNSPFGVLLAALLFGVLNTGALEIDVFTDVPRELILVIQAVTIVLVVVVNEVFRRRRAAARPPDRSTSTTEAV